MSVIIPTFNRRDRLLAALESVYAQTCPVGEIIVIDDGSTDGTSAALEALRVERPSPPMIIVAQPNRGPAAARNAGLRRARGDFVAFLDDDDVWHPEKTARQLAVFAADPDLALLGCASNEFRPAVRFEVVAVAPWQLLVRNWYMTPCAMVRRQVALSSGGFPEDMRVCEDYALWLRIALNAPIAYLNRQLVYCGGGKPGFGHSGLSANLDALYAGEREALRRWRRDAGAGAIVTLISEGLAFARHCRRGLITSLRGFRQ